MIGDLFTPRVWSGSRLAYTSQTPEPVPVPVVIDERRTVVCRLCFYERYVGDPCGEPCV